MSVENGANEWLEWMMSETVEKKEMNGWGEWKERPVNEENDPNDEWVNWMTSETEWLEGVGRENWSNDRRDEKKGEWRKVA
jgi:hypothetical protein